MWSSLSLFFIFIDKVGGPIWNNFNQCCKCFSQLSQHVCHQQRLVSGGESLEQTELFNITLSVLVKQYLCICELVWFSRAVLCPDTSQEGAVTCGEKWKNKAGKQDDGPQFSLRKMRENERLDLTWFLSMVWTNSNIAINNTVFL